MFSLSFFEFTGTASTNNESMHTPHTQAKAAFDFDASNHGYECIPDDAALRSALDGYESLNSAIKRLHRQYTENV